MPELDHLTVIAPTLPEGVAHVRECLDIDIPFGVRHDYMGTHNHRLQLGETIYLEIVARDPDGVTPPRPRWFGVDDPDRVRKDWVDGRRLRSWVARTGSMSEVLRKSREIFGEEVALPFEQPLFAFSIPRDGSLPMDGAMPSLIDRRGAAVSMANIPDLGARLQSFALEHPEPAKLQALHRDLGIRHGPSTTDGAQVRYRATIDTPSGPKQLF